MGGGGMGGLLGPAGGLYHDLGERSRRAGHRHDPRRVPQAERPRPRACSTWRRPPTSRRGRRAAASSPWATRSAARSRSSSGSCSASTAAGVVTLSTQSAGCEDGAALGETPLLLLHGDRDEILPPHQRGRADAVGHGELVILPGAGHLLTEAHDELRERLGTWIPARFAEGSGPPASATRRRSRRRGAG